MDITGFINLWIKWCTYWYNQFSGYLDDAILAISNGVNAFPGFAGKNTITLVSNTIQATCYSMLAVFTLIEIIHTYLNKGEEMRWEDVARMLIKLLICKNLLTIAPAILMVLQNTASSNIMGTEISTKVESIVTTSITLMKKDLNQYVSKIETSWSIKNTVYNMGVYLEVLFCGLGNLILAMLTTLMGIGIKAMAYLRSFEMIVLSSVSGIPLAFFAYSETKDIPKRFLLTYLAVSLQGLVIMICLSLYGNVLGTTSGKLGILIWAAITMLAISKSGQWAKDITGQ